MKSKIVKQFGAMLLAGTMIVTSGNVTTYAAEQTDETQEVDVNAESELEKDKSAEIEQVDGMALYQADMHFVKKYAEGDGYFICKESVNGMEKYVAYILIDRTTRNFDDILNEIVEYDFMTPGNVIAITTKKQEINDNNSYVKKIINKKMGGKSMCMFL